MMYGLGIIMDPAHIVKRKYFFDCVPKTSNIIKHEKNPCASMLISRKNAIKLVKNQ